MFEETISRFPKKRRYPPSNEKEEEEEEEESISRRMFEEEAVWRKRKREGMGCPRKVAKRERGSIRHGRSDRKVRVVGQVNDIRVYSYTS